MPSQMYRMGMMLTAPILALMLTIVQEPAEAQERSDEPESRQEQEREREPVRRRRPGRRESEQDSETPPERAEQAQRRRRPGEEAREERRERIAPTERVVMPVKESPVPRPGIDAFDDPIAVPDRWRDRGCFIQRTLVGPV
ncbi:MAG: hypothetical protein U5O39_20810 [Gammaproteobacteria bacterium]|nr:hypothetical protein [Gammaproteobacteria bacterium]